MFVTTDPALEAIWCETCRNKGRELCAYCETHEGEMPMEFVSVDEKFTLMEVKPISDKPIKDSGERTEFSTGAVRDMHDGKGRFDLLAWDAIAAVARHSEKASKKYGCHNVDLGIPASSLFDSCVRHLWKWWTGWEDEDHLTSAVWNCLWLLQMTLVKPEMDDRPDVVKTWKGEDS